MRIAVIGSGISGMVAAHRLQSEHEVVLFEAADRLGGHTNTVMVAEGQRQIPIDTGFIVFNRQTYPHFVALLKELDIAWVDSDMSFSARSDRRDFEYNGRNLSTLFSQRRRLLSPRFHRMVWDIFRFYRQAPELLDQPEEIELGEWLAKNSYSQTFIHDHLVPLIRAVWSVDRGVALQFPARFLVRFFANHGFLQVKNQPQWLTIPGGSRRYLEQIQRRFTGQIRLATPVERVERAGQAVRVLTATCEPEAFDHVVFACHSDQALRLLVNPSSVERKLLEAIPYQRNEAVLHTDSSVMPRLKRTWASWNVHLDETGEEGTCITYWMNSLQPIDSKHDYFVTLNNRAAIDESKIIRIENYAHPLFGVGSVAAQARHAEMIDCRGISYCGAYWRNGFHEDGVVSALAVCERLLGRAQQAEAA